MKPLIPTLIVTIIVLSTAVSCTFGRLSLFKRLSRDADADDESNPSVLPEIFGHVTDNLGLHNLFRDAKIGFLSVGEKLLEQSSEIYDNFQEAVEKVKGEDDPNKPAKTSELKKALRYLKTEARRLREDLEDEIEVEREKQAEMEAAEKQESQNKVKRMAEAIKKLDKVAGKKRKTNKVKRHHPDKEHKEHGNLEHQHKKEKVSKSSESTGSSHHFQPKEKSSKKPGKQSKGCKGCKGKSEGGNLPSYNPGISVVDLPDDQISTPPPVKSLGDGFGRHMK